MGCMSSKADINDRHPNIFQVVNINDQGQEVRTAKLEITERDIILHQRGRSGVRWPIRCLKRYGYTEGVFSFELGRRCPTGAGVYAFKCERAEALFQLLQTCIQNPAVDEGRQTPAHTADPVLVSNGDVATLPAWHGPADGSDQAVYVNEEIWTEETGAAPAAAAALAPAPAEPEPPRQPPVPAQRKSKPTHSYLNTVSCDINTNYQSAEEAEQRHLYVNVVNVAPELLPSLPPLAVPPPPAAAAAAAANAAAAASASAAAAPGAPTVAPAAPGASAEDDERCYVNIAAGSGATRGVNYAVLDLQQPGSGTRLEPPPAAAPGRPSQGYATIDFDKTAALSMAVSRVDADAELECRRKTRHNSTIVEPNLSRHNSVIST